MNRILHIFGFFCLPAPVPFGSGDNDQATIFGPLKSASNGVRYPAWGAGDYGAWRYQVDDFVAAPSLTPQDFRIPSP